MFSTSWLKWKKRKKKQQQQLQLQKQNKKFSLGFIRLDTYFPRKKFTELRLLISNQSAESVRVFLAYKNLVSNKFKEVKLPQ